VMANRQFAFGNYRAINGWLNRQRRPLGGPSSRRCHGALYKSPNRRIGTADKRG
jgi:hypothetical protein